MEPEKLRTLDLELDPKNPRIGSEKTHSQDELMELMATRYKLEELAESILASGYLPFDPLVGYRTAGQGVRVREGNRRTATLKLLLQPTLAPTRKQATWKALSERLTPEQRRSIELVDVIVYDGETGPDIESYIGFRHVNGIMEWGAQEKAGFIVRLAEEHGWSYKQIAERLGSYPKHVERHYIAHRLLTQAIEAGIPGAEQMKIGVLLRALQASGVATFLGVSYPGKPEMSRKPVEEGRIENLRDFVRWTFGTDQTRPIVGDSRELTRWGKILQSDNAVRYMRKTSTATFDRAWAKSGGELDSVVDSLLTAADRLEESVPIAALHTKQDDVREAVKRCASFVGMLLHHFPDAREALGNIPNA